MWDSAFFITVCWFCTWVSGHKLSPKLDLWAENETKDQTTYNKLVYENADCRSRRVWKPFSVAFRAIQEGGKAVCEKRWLYRHSDSDRKRGAAWAAPLHFLDSPVPGVGPFSSPVHEDFPVNYSPYVLSCRDNPCVIPGRKFVG